MPQRSGDELAPALRMAVMRLARRLRQQDASIDVTMSQLSALASVEHRGPLPLGELAIREGVQPPTMTRLVSSLEAAGLVERSSDPADRRIVRIGITDRGREMVVQSRVRRTVFLSQRLADLAPSERDALIAALPILERLAQEEA